MGGLRVISPCDNLDVLKSIFFNDFDMYHQRKEVEKEKEKC